MFAPPIRLFQLLAEHEARELVRSKLHSAILVCRKHGFLDSANVVSEWLHAWECGAQGFLPFRGLPLNNKPGVTE
jgi:hypothetical protein